MFIRRFLPIAMVLLLCFVPRAHAQWAVVDVGAITQLIQQVATMQEQLSTAKNQLTQARQQFDAMTGTRGMDGLLSGINRNYLPSDWGQLEAALQGTAGAWGSLAGSLRALIDSNAILTAADLA